MCLLVAFDVVAHHILLNKLFKCGIGARLITSLLPEFEFLYLTFVMGIIILFFYVCLQEYVCTVFLLMMLFLWCGSELIINCYFYTKHGTLLITIWQNSELEETFCSECPTCVVDSITHMFCSIITHDNIHYPIIVRFIDNVHGEHAVTFKC